MYLCSTLKHIYVYSFWLNNNIEKNNNNYIYVQEPETAFLLNIYALNAKGRSQPITLETTTLRAALKHTGKVFLLFLLLLFLLFISNGGNNRTSENESARHVRLRLYVRKQFCLDIIDIYGNPAAFIHAIYIHNVESSSAIYDSCVYVYNI